LVRADVDHALNCFDGDASDAGARSDTHRGK
jgi:hypothetical protein